MGARGFAPKIPEPPLFCSSKCAEIILITCDMLVNDVDV